MGYQALLFCPDEKLARVVSQVFSELDFAVDPVHEPFAAVKQLMAHRYDAIVVDCENEQNASLLFRSARNSSFNQSSLAFALVEGQNGIAKAYRIGANLVLTKPINLEQAKGTLRVARGLLRKSSDANVNSSTTSVASAAAAPKTLNPEGDAPAKGVPAISTHEVAAVATSHSMMSAAVAVADENTPSTVPAPAMQKGLIAESKVAQEELEIPATVEVKNVELKNKDEDASSTNAVTEEADKATVSADAQRAPVPSASGSAAAPAQAKEVAPLPGKDNKNAEKPAIPSRPGPSPLALPVLMPSSARSAKSSSFGAWSEEDSAAADRNKKILIAAAIVLALAALGYLSSGRLGMFTATPSAQPASAPKDPGQTAPEVKPMSSPEAESPEGKRGVATAPAFQPSNHPTGSATFRDKTPDDAEVEEARIPSSTESGRRKSKSSPLRPKASAPVEESVAPPSTFVAASANNNGNLGSLISSTSYTPGKPSLATLRVSQGVSQGLLIKRVQPKYPPEALAVRAQGSVQIEATINKEGNVVNPKVLKGNPILAGAALDAVRQWRYKPYYLDGQPVEIQTQVTINFKAN